MADAAEIAALFATLGLKVNAGQWAQGSAAVQGAQRAVKGLDGAFIDAQGRWRAASGRFLTMGEKMAAGLGGVGAAAGKAGAAAASAGHQAAHGWNAANTAIKGYLLYLGGHFGYEHLIKFNQEMQDNTISLAAMIEGQLGGSFQQATGKAKELYGEWQKFSTQTPVTTAEIVEFGKNIAAATFGVKGTLKDLTQITEQGVIAAKVLAGNRNAGYAALEISEMLSGNVSNRMMFVKQLLGMIHMTEEQFRGLDEKGRLEAVKKALGSDAFKDAAQAFGQSFSGVTSTLKDKLQIAVGKIGLPIFERLTASVAKFNEWLDAHQGQIEEYGKAIADFIGKAFDALSVAIDFVVEQGGELLDWLSQYIDLGRAAKSVIIALGVVLTAFAVQSAIAFATNPITLTIMALGALIYAIQALMDYPGGIEQAFSDAFDAVSDAAGRLWDAIEAGFRSAFEWVADLPVVKQLVFLIEQLGKVSNLTKTGGSGESKSGDNFSWMDMVPVLGNLAHVGNLAAGRENFSWTNFVPLAGAAKHFLGGGSTPTLPRSSEGDAGPTALNVNVGDIHVNAPNADPVAVGDQVRKVFHEELGNTIRKAQDVYG